jgi:hypothetical protein
VRGEVLDRIHEAETGILHDEADGASMRAAAEAVIELLGWADREKEGVFSEWNGQQAL